jgi:hypothetical protein
MNVGIVAGARPSVFWSKADGGNEEISTGGVWRALEHLSTLQGAYPDGNNSIYIYIYNIYVNFIVAYLSLGAMQTNVTTMHVLANNKCYNNACFS